MSNEDTKTTPQIRGPLRYQVETSTSQIEAGKEFSVSIRITNPYDVPANIRAVTTKLPAKFLDVEKLKRDRQKEDYLRRLQEVTGRLLSERMPEIQQSDESNKARRRELIKNFLRALAGPLAVSTYEVAQYVTASTLKPRPDVDKDLLEPEKAKLLIQKVQEAQKPTDAIYEFVSQELKRRMQELEEERQPEVILQPGNSIVQSFTLKTVQAVLFNPSTYNLNLQIEYQIDGNVNQDSVGYQLNVRAPLVALITGSVVGSTIGYLIRDIFDQRTLVKLIQHPATPDFVSWIIALVGNALVGALLVIAFARKKDTQPLLSIEDFWGGVFVGFLAGYMGKSVLDQFLTPAATGGSGVTPPVPSATP